MNHHCAYQNSQKLWCNPRFSNTPRLFRWPYILLYSQSIPVKTPVSRLYPHKMIIHQFSLIIWLGRNPEPYPDPRSALGLPGPTLRASVAAACPEPCHPCAHGAAKRPRGAGPDWNSAEGSEEFGCLLLCYCTSVTNSSIWVWLWYRDEIPMSFVHKMVTSCQQNLGLAEKGGYQPIYCNRFAWKWGCLKFIWISCGLWWSTNGFGYPWTRGENHRDGGWDVVECWVGPVCFPDWQLGMCFCVRR